MAKRNMREALKRMRGTAKKGLGRILKKKCPREPDLRSRPGPRPRSKFWLTRGDL